MGLDITAFQNMTLVNKNTLRFDAEGYCVGGNDNEQDDLLLTQDFHRDHFKRQFEGLVDDGYYTFQASFGFRAGSYGGYNDWRSQLAKLAGVEENILTNDNTTPFAELIYFSDCEGFIGPIVSAKLAKDFAEFHEKAEDVDDEYFFSLYCDFRQAFEMASQNGCVYFH